MVKFTFGNTVLKSNAKKIRKLYDNKVLCGFAGSTADAFTLVERFRRKTARALRKSYEGSC